ncbi:hypothetical protein C8J57DRAFT_1464352 [Mycena rebaudengoi]|nr:hypothetical protein C8J57DRAFT_1464352 [Mycena rebaudengoi]
MCGTSHGSTASLTDTSLASALVLAEQPASSLAYLSNLLLTLDVSSNSQYHSRLLAGTPHPNCGRHQPTVAQATAKDEDAADSEEPTPRTHTSSLLVPSTHEYYSMRRITSPSDTTWCRPPFPCPLACARSSTAARPTAHSTRGALRISDVPPLYHHAPSICSSPTSRNPVSRLTPLLPPAEYAEPHARTGEGDVAQRAWDFEADLSHSDAPSPVQYLHNRSVGRRAAERADDGGWGAFPETRNDPALAHLFHGADEVKDNSWAYIHVGEAVC